MRLGIDLDGPLVHFVEAYLRFHNRIYSTRFSPREIRKHYMREQLGVSEEQHSKDIFAFFESPEYGTLRPVHAALQIVRALREQHTLLVVTARSLNWQSLTAATVQQYYPDCFEGIHHTTGYGWTPRAKKAQVCKDLRLDALIEDCVENAIEVAQEGLPVLLISRPWNQDYCPLPKYVRRIRWTTVEPALRKTFSRKASLTSSSS